MATNAQAAVELQIALSGYALQGGLYVPKATAKGFAQPMGVGYGSDGTGFAMLAPAAAAAEFAAGTQSLTGTYVAGTTSPQTLTIPPPGVGLGIWLAGLIVNAQEGTGNQLVGVTATHVLAGVSFQVSSTVSTAGMLMWTPPAAWPEDTANTAVVLTVSFAPSPTVAGVVVTTYWLVRPAV